MVVGLLDLTNAPAAWKSQEARSEEQTPSVGVLIARAQTALFERGVPCSTSRLTRLVSRYVRQCAEASVVDFDDWISLTYSDPVGELATRNVLAGGVR